MLKKSVLSSLPIVNRFTHRFSGPSKSYFYNFEEPAQFPNPSLVAYSPEVLDLLNIEGSEVENPLFTQIFSGTQVVDNSNPWAARYAGFQFGHWGGMLGDGRAVNIFELQSPNGIFNVQVKGTGPTLYSRGYDGRAVLRSCVREFLCSEAMSSLGVPTVRTLCLLLTGERVSRTMFGQLPQMEPGAVVCRVSKSMIRFGSFEDLAFSNRKEEMKELLRFVIENWFPHLESLSTQDQAEKLLEEVAKETSSLMAQWTTLGFVHGVMNTDNMSILSETIDYGPFGFLEEFDREFTPNTTDLPSRRYAYGKQPFIAAWNLSNLAMALSALSEDPNPSPKGYSHFFNHYSGEEYRLFAKKLGFEEISEDKFSPIVRSMVSFLKVSRADFTLFFQELAEYKLEDLERLEDCRGKVLDKILYTSPSEEVKSKFSDFITLYSQSARNEKLSESSRIELMQKTNPRYILRNYILHNCIKDAEKGDYSTIKELQELSKNPFKKNLRFEKYYGRRPKEFDDVPGCSTLSCSS